MCARRARVSWNEDLRTCTCTARCRHRGPPHTLADASALMYGLNHTAHEPFEGHTQEPRSGSAGLASLVARCLRQPSCTAAMKAELAPASVFKWLHTGPPQPVSRTNVWVWLQYPHGMPRYIQLNMQALRLHAPPTHFRIVTLNSSTIAQWVSLPREFAQLPHESARSDVARLGLLARYGGIYIDADVLVATSLSRVLQLMNIHEHVVYTSPGQLCQEGIFSANFIATARPNTTLWHSAWQSLQDQLAQPCSNSRYRRHRICCYSQNATPVRCRTPWGLTDRIMRPIAQRLAMSLDLSLRCFDGKESFAPGAIARPHLFTVAEQSCLNHLHIYAAAAGLGNRSNGAHSTSWHCGLCRTKDLRTGPNATLCCRRRGGQLECRNALGHRAPAVNFFGRIAYHLFESVNGPLFESHAKIENANLVVSLLYRRACVHPFE